PLLYPDHAEPSGGRAYCEYSLHRWTDLGPWTGRLQGLQAWRSYTFGNPLSRIGAAACQHQGVGAVSWLRRYQSHGYLSANSPNHATAAPRRGSKGGKLTGRGAHWDVA